MVNPQPHHEMTVDYKDLLAQVLPWLEHNMPPAPDHYCGPESNCDMTCLEYFHATTLVNKIRIALREEPHPEGEEV